MLKIYLKKIKKKIMLKNFSGKKVLKIMLKIYLKKNQKKNYVKKF